MEQQGAVEEPLLRDVDWRKPVPREFDIGMDEYVDATAFQKTDTSGSRAKGKENRLSLSLKRSKSKMPADAPSWCS